MNRNNLFSALLALSLFTTSISVSPTLIVTEQIEQYSSPSNAYFQNVDFFTFSSTGGTVTFDVLEWEYGGNTMDSMIWLFNDDGSLDIGDLVSENDDSNSTFGDGSITTLDSWLSVGIGAGNYIFAVGECCNFGASDIIDGIQTGIPSDLSGATITNIYDYQLTITGDVDNFRLQGTDIPEPSTVAIFALGVMGLALRRFKKKS